MESFSELSLSPELQSAIKEMGFDKPSPIQAQALPLLLTDERTDFLGLAGTGTGKTAAFGIPMIEKIDMDKKAVQALILCPTRELAMQVSKQINLLGKNKGVKAVPVYGGSSFGDQRRGMEAGKQVVVGTPGRVIEHIQKGTFQLGDLKTVILDEADEMVSMGFKDELEMILKGVPRESCNIWLFSATMGREVRRVADTYMKNPKMVQLNRKEMLPEKLEQLYYVTQESNKAQVLCKLIEAADEFYGLIFCQTKALVGDLTNYLNERGYKTGCLHGDIDQSSRERTMQAFRDKRVQILVCTDVAARGIDVQDITHVVNYSIPRELDSYVHRIGRTARSGKTGVAMSLVTHANKRLIPRIESMTKSRMKEGTVPSGKDLGMKKLAAMLPEFEAQTNFSRAESLLSDEWQDAIEDMSPNEIVARLLGVLLPDMLKDAPERVMLGIPSQLEDAQGGRDRGGRSGGGRDRGGRPGRDRGPRSGGDRGDRKGPRKSFGGGGGKRPFGKSSKPGGKASGKPSFRKSGSNSTSPRAPRPS
ncbi:DEAD/DEAH box helicase [bacterium]|nr:DEAD/DEAH box helicase [bacterium]